MTTIDWSDPAAMFGLLCEFVAEERVSGAEDEAREAFLAGLLDDLDDLASRFADLTPDETLDELRALRAAQSDDFSGDEVLVHIDDCIVELERLNRS